MGIDQHPSEGHEMESERKGPSRRPHTKTRYVLTLQIYWDGQSIFQAEHPC
jgi:hypothetical protein